MGAMRIAVKPAGIEQELTNAWRQAADADSAREAAALGGAEPRVKVTLSNIILCADTTHSNVSPQLVERIIEDLCATHPARFFIVEPNLQADAPPIETAVSSRCVMADSGSHVCSEEIYIAAAVKGIEPLNNLVLSLLVPDVETITLFFADPCAAEGDWPRLFADVSKELFALSDRVIYDSLLFSDYECGIAQLAAFAGGSAFDLSPFLQGKYRDLNWRRIKRWRTLLAEQFDGLGFDRRSWRIAEAALSSAIGVPRLIKGFIPSGSLLMIGWFASRLQWKIEDTCRSDSGSVCLAGKDNNNQGVSLRLTASAANVEAELEHLIAISVRASDGKSDIALEIERLIDAPSCRVTIETKAGRTERILPFAAKPMVELLADDLVSGEPSLDFYDAFKTVNEIALALLKLR